MWPPPDPQLIDFTIDTKEITGYYGLLLQKEFTYPFDILLLKEYSGLHDILLQNSITGSYDILLQKVIEAYCDILLQKEFTGINDIFLQKTITGNYTITEGGAVNKEFTGSHDILLQKEYSGLADILIQIDFEGSNDILVKKEVTGQYTIVTTYDSTEYTGKYDVHIKKEFTGKYDIYTPATVHLFNVFDHMYSLYHINILSKGYTNSNGDWVAESSEEIALYAHISDISIQELKFINPVLVSRGARKIAVLNSAGLSIGDRIRITEIDNSTTSTWRIYQKQYCPALIESYVGINRETFIMTRVI